MTDTPDHDLDRADQLANRAIALNPGSMIAHQGKAQALRAQRRWEEATLEYEKVIEINRNFPWAYVQLGDCILLTTGAIDEASSRYEQAVRLSPREPGIDAWYLRLGRADLLRLRTDEAIAWFRKAKSANSGNASVRAWLAAAYALRGDTVPAAAELKAAQEMNEVFSSLARLKNEALFAAPNSRVRDLFEATYFAGLRKAGMPEE